MFQLLKIRKDWKEERDPAAEMSGKTEKMKKELFKLWKAIKTEGPNDWWESERQIPVKGGKLNY